MTILVTGAAGFVGSHVTQTLLARGERVVGLDNLNDYYSPARKRANLAEIGESPAFRFVEGDIRDPDALSTLFSAERPDKIIHLAAMPGSGCGLRPVTSSPTSQPLTSAPTSIIRPTHE